MKTKTTWILIADGAQARVLRAQGRRNELVAVPDCNWEVEHPADHEINSDKPGRSFDSVGAGRHAMEPTSSPHRRNKAQFAVALAAHLEESHRSKIFDKLILVASPKTLGDLRNSLSKDVLSCVLGEVPKDLTKATNDEISAHLEQYLYA